MKTTETEVKLLKERHGYVTKCHDVQINTLQNPADACKRMQKHAETCRNVQNLESYKVHGLLGFGVGVDEVLDTGSAAQLLREVIDGKDSMWIQAQNGQI